MTAARKGESGRENVNSRCRPGQENGNGGELKGFGPNMEPGEVIEKVRRHLDERGFGDIEVTVRDNYTWSKTDAGEDVVARMIGAYRRHGVEPEIWPMATWAAPYQGLGRGIQFARLYPSGGLTSLSSLRFFK